MLGTIWNTILFHPFLNLLVASYNLLWDNLGLAVIFIAVVIRILLIPSVKSQTEMTRKMSSLRPELSKLQKKYANNQKKLAEEQMKLYKKVGYNPIGCLGSFLPQILILYAIIQVINVVTTSNFDGVYPFISSWVFGSGNGATLNTQFLTIDLAKSFSEVTKSGYFNTQAISIIIMGILVGITQYVSTKFMQHLQGQSTPVTSKKKKANEPPNPEELQAQMMSSMNLMFPFMTFFITLTTPAVLGLYWLAQSIMLIVQYFIIDKEKSIEAAKKLLSIKEK